MEISSVSLSSPVTLSSANLQQEVALRVLKESIDFQGELALSLLPQAPTQVSSQPAPVDPSSSVGQNINIHV